MAKRQSLEVPGIGHSNPLPMGSKIGSMVYSSGIFGTDPETGKVPPTAEAQAEHAFNNMRALLEQAGGTPDDIIYVTVYMKDRAQRNAINAPWLKMFPDEHSRPGRHAIESNLPEGNFLQLQCVAVLGGGE